MLGGQLRWHAFSYRKHEWRLGADTNYTDADLVTDEPTVIRENSLSLPAPMPEADVANVRVESNPAIR